MEEQKDIVAGKGDMGHTMRLGSYPAELEEAPLSPNCTAPRMSPNATATVTR